jgi:hypothetical protein
MVNDALRRSIHDREVDGPVDIACPAGDAAYTANPDRFRCVIDREEHSRVHVFWLDSLLVQSAARDVTIVSGSLASANQGSTP